MPGQLRGTFTLERQDHPKIAGWFERIDLKKNQAVLCGPCRRVDLDSGHGVGRHARWLLSPGQLEELKYWRTRGRIVQVYGSFTLPDGTNAFYVHTPWDAPWRTVCSRISRFVRPYARDRTPYWNTEPAYETGPGYIQDFAKCEIFKHFVYTPEGLQPKE